MAKLAKSIVFAATLVFFIAGHAYSKNLPECEKSGDLAVSVQGSFHTNYKHLGSVKLWRGASPNACQIELVKGGMTELEQLQRLIEVYYISSAHKSLNSQGLVRSCKLFVDDDVELDVRTQINQMKFSYVPQLILYVARIEGGSLFYLECFEGSEVSLMPAQPSDL